jgi:hypothetical protein
MFWLTSIAGAAPEVVGALVVARERAERDRARLDLVSITGPIQHRAAARSSRA